MSELDLAPELVDRIAERVAERVLALLGERAGDRLLDAADVAQRLGRSREWVYRHADQLGAVRLGDGARPRLGFDPARVASYVDACTSSRRTGGGAEPGPAPDLPPRRYRSAGQGRDLLPIRGEAPCP